MPKGLFKNKDVDEKTKARNKAKSEKKKFKRSELKYILHGNTLRDFEFAINQRYGPDDGSKTPPGFQAKISQFACWSDLKVDENTPQSDQKS